MPRPPAIPIEERDWMTTPEVAKVFGVATGTIRVWLRQGKLHSKKISGYNRITKEEVSRYAKEIFGLEGEW